MEPVGRASDESAVPRQSASPKVKWLALSYDFDWWPVVAVCSLCGALVADGHAESHEDFHRKVAVHG